MADESINVKIKKDTNQFSYVLTSKRLIILLIVIVAAIVGAGVIGSIIGRQASHPTPTVASTVATTSASQHYHDILNQLHQHHQSMADSMSVDRIRDNIK